MSAYVYEPNSLGLNRGIVIPTDICFSVPDLVTECARIGLVVEATGLVDIVEVLDGSGASVGRISKKSEALV